MSLTFLREETTKQKPEIHKKRRIYRRKIKAV